MIYAQRVKELELSLLAKDILHSLIYFDIFNYPLKLEEIHANSTLKGVGSLQLKEEIDKLVELGIINNIDEWYFLYNNASIITDRIKGNKRALSHLKLARKIGRFMSWFPFVRAVLISGSLSKGYMDKKSDIDFFIVTAPNRLWLTRTSLILFKKIFLLNSKKYFCPNYFIDTEHLKIKEQNVFTAKEINYLIPVYNSSLYDDMLQSNEWRSYYMPNFTHKRQITYSGTVWIKRQLERLLSGPLGERLDNYFMKITEAFWKRKFRHQFPNAVDVQCSKHVSKFHPNGYQNKVLMRFQQNVLRLESLHQINLN
ncbi:MAG: hypothetical protein JWO58_2328 [Chitinophagaceae bacterium]|nr:hypothetical protein [Chitinophagaceae bacterium]